MSYADPEKRRECNRRSARKHRARMIAYTRIWRKQNPEKRRAQKRRAYARLRNSSIFRLQNSLRSRLSVLLRGKVKCSVFFELLCMPLREFQIYLQGQFQKGMTWENYGRVWHADHIRPCSAFDLSDPEQQRACFHWSNFQPLFAEENLRKGAKYVSNA